MGDIQIKTDVFNVRKLASDEPEQKKIRNLVELMQKNRLLDKTQI